MPAHADPMDIVDYVCGRIRGRHGRWLRQHCRGCEVCGDQLAAVIMLRGNMLVGAARRRSPRRVAAVAAMVAFVIAIAWTGSVVGLRAPVTVVSAVAPAEVAERAKSGTTMTRAAIAAEVAGLHLRVEVFEMIYLGDAAITSAMVDGDGQSLSAALRALQRGDIAAVIDELEPFARRYHVHGTPLLGAARYVMGDRGEETAMLLELAAAQVSKEEPDPSRLTMQRVGTWYLARLKRDRGDLVAAEHLLSVLAVVNDMLGRDALALLNAGVDAPTQ